jgi:hypothetical protein
MKNCGRHIGSSPSIVQPEDAETRQENRARDYRDYEASSIQQARRNFDGGIARRHMDSWWSYVLDRRRFRQLQFVRPSIIGPSLLIERKINWLCNRYTGSRFNALGWFSARTRWFFKVAVFGARCGGRNYWVVPFRDASSRIDCGNHLPIEPLKGWSEIRASRMILRTCFWVVRLPERHHRQLGRWKRKLMNAL